MLNSLNEPIRCLNHSRATKIGQRMWKRNALCSKGVPCLSRIRKRISPSSDSSISSLRRAKLTRAALTTERSVAMAASRRTKPWSSTRTVFSGNTSGVTAMAASVTRAYVGASGFSYPSWRDGFYPADAKPADFPRLYAERLPSVELNTTGYRVPAPEQFERWAGATPAGFRFAVKLRWLDDRVRLLGERLGPVRVVVQAKHDDRLLERLASTDLPLALDLRHPSWDGVDVSPAVRVNDWEADAPFRYLRFRDPPYSERDLEQLAGRIAPLLDAGVDVYAYFRHEDEPSAPAYALRLLQLLGSQDASTT